MNFENEPPHEEREINDLLDTNTERSKLISILTMVRDFREQEYDLDQRYRQLTYEPDPKVQRRIDHRKPVSAEVNIA